MTRVNEMEGRVDREEKEAMMEEKEHHAWSCQCVRPMPVERDDSLSGSNLLVRELGPPVRQRTYGVI